MKHSTLAILIGFIAANSLASVVVPKEHDNGMRIQARYEPVKDIVMDVGPDVDIEALLAQLEAADHHEVSGQPHGLPHHDHEHTHGPVSNGPTSTEVFSGPAGSSGLSGPSMTTNHGTVTASSSHSHGPSATETAESPGTTHGSAPAETHSSIDHSSGAYCTPKTSHAGSCSACTVIETTYVSGSTSASSAGQTHTGSHSSGMGSSSVYSGKPSSSMYYGNSTFTSKWASSTDPATSIVKNGTVTTGLPPIATQTGGAGIITPGVGLLAVVAAGMALL
ncbi:hypothetical protein FPQ18DRAFT_425685 [Pyronema domesticum]|uniref:Uncharacterized protein n=1 Tax=Pyronema omphalodes (strain CBS 100304) TaxID=1076935 RepID=U4L3X5_PYROM|nr:hypothetical protein FPQ18DRAFT_425685 [Pyronema domesticum]CCX10399.1 Protein of unknown function [Pyronema omphalodes CBS 100304]